MAPTVNASRPQDKRVLRPGERKSDLVCRVKYCNTLPDIPFDLKFINYPFPTNRYVQYKPTSLEKNYKYDILTEHDLGVNIDLIDPSAYAQAAPHMSPGPSNLHPDDEKLLEDDTHTPQAAKKSRHSHVNVSWLRRTEYISTELTRFQPQNNDRIEATVGYGGRKKAKAEAPSYTDRESQLEAIEKTFEAAKEPLIDHYSKPGVKAVEELPIFPDFDMWKFPCAQVIFDSDPAPPGRPATVAMDEMSQAMIRGVMDESGEQFVAYFLPTEDTIKKRKRDVDDEVDYKNEDEYEYVMNREYNWNVKNKASKGYEENYFLVLRDDAAYYNELETRVRLSKRRQKVGDHARNKSRLVVTHRPLTANEHRAHQHRENMLLPPGEEEEDDYEEEEEELPQQEEEDLVDIDGKRSRSGSKSRSVSRSKSRSNSRSRSRSKSRSVSRSKSRSASRSKSRSVSRSKSRSVSRSKSRSVSRSKSRSRSHSKSKSRSRSRSGSRRSGSRTPSRSRSKSGSRSRSRSRSGSRSRSKSRSRSVSRSRSPSGSRSRSNSGSPSRSKSRSVSRSRSGSPAGSERSGTKSGKDSDSD